MPFVFIHFNALALASASFSNCLHCAAAMKRGGDCLTHVIGADLIKYLLKPLQRSEKSPKNDKLAWQVIIASHSWGDNVFRAFMQWADSVDESWVEKHIKTYINLAGPVLGVPKSIPAFLSGLPLPQPLRIRGCAATRLLCSLSCFCMRI